MKQYYQYAASTWLFFSALTAFGGDIQCPNQVDIDIGNAKKFKARLENSVFQVVIESDSQPQKEETIGTATLVSSEGHLLTAAHIFEADNNRILRGIDNNQLKLFLRIPVDENEYVKYRSSNVIKLSDKHDLSVITLSDWDNNERFFPIWLDVKNDPYNDDARLMGYIINKRYPSVSGKGNIIRVSDEEDYLRITHLEAYQGFSGGMIINSSGMGVAVLSGKFSKNGNNDITWAEIGDMENEALNAVSLRSVIEKIYTIKSVKAENMISRLKNINKNPKEYELSDFIKSDRFAAIIMISRLIYENDTLKKLSSRDTQWNIFKLSDCLMPSKTTKDVFFKLYNSSISKEQRNWFGKKVAKYSLQEARESKDVERSLGMFDIAVTAMTMDEVNIYEAYVNYAFLDYYKAAMAAIDSKASIAHIEAPSAIIGTSISKITQDDLQDTEVSMQVAISRSLLFSAATSEFKKEGRYQEGLVTASAALKASKNSKENITEMIKDWYYLSNQAIASCKEEELCSILKFKIDAACAVNIKNSNLCYDEVVYLDKINNIDKFTIDKFIYGKSDIDKINNIDKFIYGKSDIDKINNIDKFTIDKISTPSALQLKNVVEILGTINH